MKLSEVSVIPAVRLYYTIVDFTSTKYRVILNWYQDKIKIRGC